MSELEAQKAYERETKPSALKGLIFVLLLAVIAVVIGTFVVGNRLPEGPKVAEAKPIPLSVETMTVALEKAFTVDEKFTGIITPRRTSQLGFSSGGRIESLSADVGDRVRSGRTLATLDVRGLTAQLAAAEAVVAEAEASHALALATVQRQSTLSAKGHVSQQRVDEATAQANTAAARIAVTAAPAAPGQHPPRHAREGRARACAHAGAPATEEGRSQDRRNGRAGARGVCDTTRTDQC